VHWCDERTTSSEIVFDAPDGIARDEAQVEARFGPFGDSSNLDAWYMHSLCRTYHRVRNHFRCTRWYSEVMRLKGKLILVRLEIVLILTQDTSTVCTEHTIGSKIILDVPDKTPR
jgi:hypothetical protein